MTDSFPVRFLSRLVGRQGVAHSSKNDEMRGRGEAS